MGIALESLKHFTVENKMLTAKGHVFVSGRISKQLVYINQLLEKLKQMKM